MANPLKQRREQLGLSQLEIGLRFSPVMSQSAVCSWENDGSAFAKKLIPQVAAAYGITVERAAEIRRQLKTLLKRKRTAA